MYILVGGVTKLLKHKEVPNRESLRILIYTLFSVFNHYALLWPHTMIKMEMKITCLPK